MIKNPDRLTLVLWVLLFLLLGLSIGNASQNNEAAFKIVIERIEKAIIQAEELYEQGEIPEGKPFIVPITADFQLSFSAENFQGDADKAFQVLDQLTAEQKKQTVTAQVPAPAPKAKETSPRNREQGRLAALMEAEKRTAKASPPAAEQIPLEYSIHKKYQQDRQARLQEEEAGIEADKQIILAERQAVAQEELRKREREQQLQAQSAQWQEELDKQAKASSQAALQWEKENSFGAHFTRFLGTVLQTSVGAFTGGILGTLGTNLANHAVSKLFPDAATNTTSQAMAAGTSAAITGTATGIGQAVGQGAGSAVANETPEY